MTKVLFILSAVVMLVATVFAYKNFEQFKTARTDRLSTNQKVEAERSAALKVQNEVNSKIADINKTQQELDVESQKKKAQELRIAQADNESKRVQEELAAKELKMQELNAKLAKLPPGVSTETLAEDVSRIKKTIGELNGQAELKKKDLVTQEAKVTEANRALEDIVRKIEERKKSFDRNSLMAQIVAVNRDWGFVVVNAGQTQGITEATKLLVTRGNQTVGKLNIISVQGNRTVANILPETLAQGLTIQPGDQVILENLYQ